MRKITKENSPCKMFPLKSRGFFPQQFLMYNSTIFCSPVSRVRREGGRWIGFNEIPLGKSPIRMFLSNLSYPGGDKS